MLTTLSHEEHSRKSKPIEPALDCTLPIESVWNEQKRPIYHRESLENKWMTCILFAVESILMLAEKKPPSKPSLSTREEKPPKKIKKNQQVSSLYSPD